MPARGPLPKPADQRIRRNKESGDWREVPNVPFEGGRELPFEPENNFTTLWWDTVRSMPHCSLWSASDWMFAFGTAQVADRFADNPKDFAAELRQREKVLGLTDDDRIRLKIRYVDVASDAEGANVAQMSDYRDL